MNFKCGKRYINGIDTFKIFLEGNKNISLLHDGEKCGGDINVIDNRLICQKCGHYFGTARGKDKNGLEVGIVALLEEVIKDG